MAEAALVNVEDLSVKFVSREATVHAVNGVSFTLKRGEVLGILGESGSGKSVTLRALMRLLPRGKARVCERVEPLLTTQDTAPDHSAACHMVIPGSGHSKAPEARFSGFVSPHPA